MNLLKQLRTLNFLLAFPLFQNIPLTSHDPRGHAVLCGHFIVFLSFSCSSWTCRLADILWVFCYFNILRGQAIFWTFLCFSFIFIFLVDMLSCGHFVVFCHLNIPRGQVVIWTLPCFLLFLFSS